MKQEQTVPANGVTENPAPKEKDQSQRPGEKGADGGIRLYGGVVNLTATDEPVLELYCADRLVMAGIGWTRPDGARQGVTMRVPMDQFLDVAAKIRAGA